MKNLSIWSEEQKMSSAAAFGQLMSLFSTFQGFTDGAQPSQSSPCSSKVHSLHFSLWFDPNLAFLLDFVVDGSLFIGIVRGNCWLSQEFDGLVWEVLVYLSSRCHDCSVSAIHLKIFTTTQTFNDNVLQHVEVQIQKTPALIFIKVTTVCCIKLEMCSTCRKHKYTAVRYLP